MVTVALPTYANKQIIHLTLEGLTRQKTTCPWELIVYECASLNEAGRETIEPYWPRLKKAGCVRLLYMYSQSRKPLNRKWVEMAQRAKGEVFCLQGSDDYPHPERNQIACDAIGNGADWYDCRYYYQYHLIKEKLIMFDNFQTNDDHRPDWKTGFNMAMKTDAVANIKIEKDLRSGIDFWLMENIKTAKREIDQNHYKGVSTTGMNTISLRRVNYFDNPMFPFAETEKTINDIGLPKKVTGMIESLRHDAIYLGAKDKKYKVKFTRNINGKQIGQKAILNHETMNYFWMRSAIEILRETPYETEFELTK